MKKSAWFILLVCALLLSGCSAPLAVKEQATQAPAATQPAQELTQYTATFLELFDTVTTLLGRAESEEAFTLEANAIRDELRYYHQLFDIYNSYEGMNNLKTVNDQAGVAPVRVDEALLQLLKDCKVLCEKTHGRVNVAMGSVLALWHNERASGRLNPQDARLPDMDALREAAQHTAIDALVIDEAAGTVFITDPLVRLDVGAIAKGWAVQRVAEHMPHGMLLSVGGNVACTGPKKADGTPWVVGVQNPDGGDEYLHTLNVTGGCVVTSGDYQRTYVVDGKFYHHIIDPDTLYPAARWRAVTVLHRDSGEADALSTALFILPLEDGMALLREFGAEAMWVDQDGNRHYSDGFMQHVRK